MRCPAASIKPQPPTSLLPLPIGPLSLSRCLLRLPPKPRVASISASIRWRFCFFAMPGSVTGCD